MKMFSTGLIKRLVAGPLVAAVIVGVSTLAIHAPVHNQDPVTLKRIQTDKATTFYADMEPDAAWFVEMVLPGTSDSKAATENLKLVAATL